MGIIGLHKSLAFCTKKGNVHDFSGAKLAIDASSWLHKSVYSIAERYVESMETGQVEPHCVCVSAKYIISRCEELIHRHRIAKVLLVMDGKRCPLKADTNQERERRRQQNLAEARKFKFEGQTVAAFEKYKSCIKIRDQLTKEVMRIVEQHFIANKKLELVWSPYEADAQLVRLFMDKRTDAIITEDSDVLVYSASSHVTPPILFKLDRHSGSCDVIDLSWLISSGSNTNLSPTKTSSALEALLRNFSSRQSRRPGSGVRLFVQACILTGCDYAPSRINGLGLVTAFKNVRDNSHRKHSERFGKILASLPRKLRHQINVEEYELLLAKSEAVFYYHVVRHVDGTDRPLNELRFRKDPLAHDKVHQDQFPSIERFENDLSFLGETRHPLPRSEIAVHNRSPPPPISEIIIRHDAPLLDIPRAERKIELKRKYTIDPVRTIINPYRSNKRQATEERRPLHRLDPNSCGDEQKTVPNRFGEFALRNDVTTSNNGSGNLRRLPKNTDKRFVKPKFPKVHGLGKHFNKSKTTTDYAQFQPSIHGRPSLKSRPFERDLEHHFPRDNSPFVADGIGSNLSATTSMLHTNKIDGWAERGYFNSASLTNHMSKINAPEWFGDDAAGPIQTDVDDGQSSVGLDTMHSTLHRTFARSTSAANINNLDQEPQVQRLLKPLPIQSDCPPSREYRPLQYSPEMYSDEASPIPATRSKYFVSNVSRRVTLDPPEEPTEEPEMWLDPEASEPVDFYEAVGGFSPAVPNVGWNCSEQLESPGGDTFGNYCSNPYKTRVAVRNTSESKRQITR